MKSIERKFKKISRRNPYWSSYVCFVETIYGISFSRQSIHRWFNVLVSKDDYDKTNKKELMAFLESIGKCSTATKKRGLLPQEATK